MTRSLPRPDAGLQRALVLLWFVLAVSTGLAYLLPLDQGTTDLVSNLSFGIAGLTVIGSVMHAQRMVSGLDRLAWCSIALTMAAALALFALDPAASNGTPTLALLVAPIVALSIMTSVLVLGRATLTGLRLTRILLDGAWLNSGILVAIWSWVMAPLPTLVESTAELVYLGAFPIITVIGSVTTLLLLPRAAGSASWSLAFIGSGAAVCAVAGTFHVRLGVEGTLTFGTWYDYLWTIGLALIGLAALDPTMGRRMRTATPSIAAQQLITGAPLLIASLPFLTHGWDSTPSELGLAMLGLLALRVVVLISENGRLTAQLEDHANRDELTGLLNRRALLDLLDPTNPSVTPRRSSETPQLTVLYLDLDRFKQINDTHGHAAGDFVLLQVARKLSEAVREGDAVARLGGDEFVVVTEHDDARRLAERIRSSIVEPLVWNGRPLSVGCSIGVAHGRDQTPLGLLALADSALYRDKQSSRERREADQRPTFDRANGQPSAR